MEKILRWLFHILKIFTWQHLITPNLHPKIKISIERNFKELLFSVILIKNQNGKLS